MGLTQGLYPGLLPGTMKGLFKPDDNGLSPGLYKEDALSSVALLKGLIGYWPLEGNSIDLFGRNNGTDTNITYSTGNGKIGQGAGFNGSTSIIKKVSPSLLRVGNSFSISAWFKPAAVGITAPIFGMGDQSDADLMMYVATTNKLVIQTYERDNAHGTSLVGSTSVTTSIWYHAVAVRDALGGKLRLYLNGKEDIPPKTIPTTNIFWGAGTKNLVFGKRDTVAQAFNGAIDEIGYWDRPLSIIEIVSLYNSGFGKSYPFST